VPKLALVSHTVRHASSQSAPAPSTDPPAHTPQLGPVTLPPPPPPPPMPRSRAQTESRTKSNAGGRDARDGAWWGAYSCASVVAWMRSEIGMHEGGGGREEHGMGRSALVSQVELVRAGVHPKRIRAARGGVGCPGGCGSAFRGQRKARRLLLLLPSCCCCCCCSQVTR
jgi:hypothetical protein